MSVSAHLSRIAVLGFALTVFLAASTANAAIIPVSPGTNTLQTAITTASSGDVLELEDGTYFGAVNVSGKNLTIRGRPGSTSLLPDDVSVSSAHRLVLQGLSFTEGVKIFTSNTSATLVVLQSTFKDALLKCQGIRCVVVGNKFDPQSSTFVRSNLIGGEGTVESVFAGNEMQSRARSGSSSDIAYFYFRGGASHIIGNRFRLDSMSQIYQYLGYSLLHVEQGVVNIMGNRFEMFLDSTYSDSVDVYAPSMVRVSNATAVIRNNVFTLESASGISLDTTGYRVSGLHALNLTPAGGEVRIQNNVFDYRNISFGASVNPARGAVFAQRHVQALEGNVFLGIQHGAVEVASGVFASISHNLCHQVGSACPGAGALTANPLFVDAAAGNYHLQAGSPAINAGPESPYLVDIDGSPNDMGVHGGPFDLDQFDAQRGPGTLPFVYPLFEANRAIDGNGNLQIRLLGVARNQ